MNKRWLFLRGAVPTDRDPLEIEHATLEQEDDMWMHLFAGLVGDYDIGHAVYYNAQRFKCFHYRENFNVWHYPALDTIQGMWDYIFCRGGFPIYDKLLERIGAYKIYYGAGKRFYPPINGYCKYDLILVDSEKQQKDVLSIYPYIRCEKIIKPAAPVFYPRNVKKEFDCCFVAGVPNPCKMVQWVYDTCPRDISILQLGYTPDSYPENVTVRRVPRWEMPEEICRCRIGIVPYMENDSAPRVISEFVSCGVPVTICEDVNWDSPNYYRKSQRNLFWNDVQYTLEHIRNGKDIRKHVEGIYNNFLSLPIAISHLKKIIGAVDYV